VSNRRVDTVYVVSYAACFRFGSRHKHGLAQDQSGILRFAATKLVGGKSDPTKFLESSGAKLCELICTSLHFRAHNPL
jgi:hypothetical protein